MSQVKLSPLMAVGWDGKKFCGGNFFFFFSFFHVFFSSLFPLTIFVCIFALAVLGVWLKVIDGIYTNDVKHLLSHHAILSAL